MSIITSIFNCFSKFFRNFDVEKTLKTYVPRLTSIISTVFIGRRKSVEKSTVPTNMQNYCIQHPYNNIIACLIFYTLTDHSYLALKCIVPRLGLRLPHDIRGMCAPGRVLCETSDRCIPVSYVCDFIPHCEDKSDERGCGKGTSVTIEK